MGLKSIEKNYATLLKAFAEAGVTITEAQKESLDKFMLSLESKINETRDSAIRATRKVVEEKLENEYREVVESIIKHQKEHSELAGKIQDKVIQINESNKIAEAVDSYLDQYVEEILPKKTIVDYSKMEKLERIQESLKDMLLVNDAAVEHKVEQIKEDMLKESKGLKDEVESLKTKLNESLKKETELTKKLDESKVREFVDSKTKDLPVCEAMEMKKRLNGMTLGEIKKNFNTILESVQDGISSEKTDVQEEENLEEAISRILEGNKKASEETNSDKDAEGTEVVSTDQDKEADAEDDENDSEVVNEAVMECWINTLNRITPKK